MSRVVANCQVGYVAVSGGEEPHVQYDALRRRIISSDQRSAETQLVARREW